MALYTKVSWTVVGIWLRSCFYSLTSSRHLGTKVSRTVVGIWLLIVGLFSAVESSEIRGVTYSSAVPCVNNHCWRFRPSKLLEYCSFFCDDVVVVDFESLDGKETVELALECVHGGSEKKTFNKIVGYCKFTVIDPKKVMVKI